LAQDEELAQKAIQILKQNCLECHGPIAQRNGLRLDSREGLLAGGNSGSPAFLSNDTAASPILQRITSPNADYRMPFGRKALSKTDIETLKNWFEADAPWPENADPSEHWAFKVPFKKAFAPWDLHLNPIDYFIQEKLKTTELTRSKSADKYALIRRAFLELTGIPPTPKEIETFLKDESEGAYERLLDRLFQSPRYGEHQAVRWLDIARYADTNGYEKDRPRTMWPYRDWVINAFNANMPFDEFITEQLAGDLLPNATESQKIATGFHRNAMLNEEGGIDAAEDRFKRTVDRTNTTGTALLGLTVACAQCHTHKYDPISRTEYYKLFAYFNDTEETILDLPDEKIMTRQATVDAIVAELNEEMSAQVPADASGDEDFLKWAEGLPGDAAFWIPASPLVATSVKGATLNRLKDQSILATGDIPNDDVYHVALHSSLTDVTAMRIEVLPDESLPGGGPGRGTILAEGDFLLTGLELEFQDGINQEITPIPLHSSSEDYATKGRSAAQALDGKDDTGWSVKGATGKAHWAVYNFEKPMDLTKGAVTLRLHQDYIHQHTIGRFRVSFTNKTEPARALPVPADLEQILFQMPPGKKPEHILSLKKYYYAEVSPINAELRSKRDKSITRRPKYNTALTFSPRMPARETRTYNRGEFLSPRRKVEPDVPAILHDIDQDIPQDRRALSAWLMSPENPLTARVLVNQLWQQVFGRGLVHTTEDFGVRGSPPSHPEMLDWLAVELIDSAWDMKAMHRLMVSSDTFKQSTVVTSRQLEVDPDNVLLSRGPRFRLTAESIRDTALQAAGLLSDAIGGRSVYPPEPPGVATLAYSKSNWPTSTGEARHRRSMYTYWKRTSPYAGGTTFDMPTREETCVRRSRTNTPLQALTLMNDTVFTEIAQALGKRVLNQDGSLDEKIDFLFLSTLSRYPDNVERRTVRGFFRQQKKDFKKETDTARDIGGAISALTTTDELPDLAAWVAVSRIILNLDEMIVRG
jgi:hypothetical protein